MAKFMVLYKSSMSAKELMAGATPEQMKAAMAEWITWKDGLDSSMGFEWGLPLQAESEVTADSVQDSQSTVSGYAIMEGDKDAITQVLQSHPHLQREGATIEVLEMIPMPGM